MPPVASSGGNLDGDWTSGVFMMTGSVSWRPIVPISNQAAGSSLNGRSSPDHGCMMSWIIVGCTATRLHDQINNLYIVGLPDIPTGTCPPTATRFHVVFENHGADQGWRDNICVFRMVGKPRVNPGIRACVIAVLTIHTKREKPDQCSYPAVFA